MSDDANAGREELEKQAKEWFLGKKLAEAIHEISDWRSEPEPPPGNVHAYIEWTQRGKGEENSPQARITREIEVLWKDPESRAGIVEAYQKAREEEQRQDENSGKERLEQLRRKYGVSNKGRN